MKIKSFFIYIAFGLLFLTLSYSYYNFPKKYNLILENYDYLSHIKADQVRYNISSMIDSIMGKFVSNQEFHTKIYYEIIEKLTKNPNLSLDDIKKEYEAKYDDRLFELYLINKDLVIYDTTYKADLGLDFKNIPDVYDSLKSLYDRKRVIDISFPKIEAFSNNYIQYFVHKPENTDFMVELGIMFDKEKVLNKYYESIQNQTPSLLNFSIYNFVYDKDKNINRIDKMALENIFALKYKTKKEVLNHREQSKQFGKIYKNIFQKDAPQSVVEVQNDLNDKIVKNNGVVSFLSKEPDSYINTLLMPISNFHIASEDLILASYIVMEFDATEQFNKIKEYKLLNILFNIFYFSFIIFIIYKVYQKILHPLDDLTDAMKTKKTLNIKTNNKDEIAFMARTYNDLFIDLHNQIDNNQMLLNENKQFIADMVHQIRTPLTVIMTNSSFIEMESEQHLHQYIDQINSSINMLSNSYEDLAYIISNDTIEYKPVKIELSRFLEDRIMFFDTIAKANQKSITSEIEKNISLIINDTELERLIDNNISNAIKHGVDYDKIKIVLKKEDDTIVLKFISKGKKIANPSNLFEKNYTESNKSKRSLGLGLFMVKKICEKNNISYDVNSKNNQNTFIYKF